jgi:Protein of unknown function (DUF3617)
MFRRGPFRAPLLPALALALAAPALAVEPAASPGQPLASPESAAPPRSEAEADVPTLQPGMWQYERTVSSRTRTPPGQPRPPAQSSPAQTKISKCTNPTLEMRNKIAELKKKGCRFMPTVHTGNTYRASWACPTHGGVLILTQVLTVENDNGYEDASEARFEEQVTRTKIVATRVGDCPLLPGVPKQRHRPPPLSSPPSSSPPGGS